MRSLDRAAGALLLPAHARGPWCLALRLPRRRRRSCSRRRRRQRARHCRAAVAAWPSPAPSPQAPAQPRTLRRRRWSRGAAERVGADKPVRAAVAAGAAVRHQRRRHQRRRPQRRRRPARRAIADGCRIGGRRLQVPMATQRGRGGGVAGAVAHRAPFPMPVARCRAGQQKRGGRPCQATANASALRLGMLRPSRHHRPEDVWKLAACRGVPRRA